MFDPFMTGLSLGWTFLAAGVISTLVIATRKTSNPPDMPPQSAIRNSKDQGLPTLTRWSLVVLAIAVGCCGAFRIQEDHDWSPLQKPHSYLWESNTKCSPDSSAR
jgi:hypothetical protein